MMTFCLKIAVHVIVVEIVWEIVLPVIQSFTNLTIHQNKISQSDIKKKSISEKTRENENRYHAKVNVVYFTLIEQPPLVGPLMILL